MTDRELLEAAARAAGIDLDWDVPPKSPPWRMSGEGEDRGPAAQWTPLTDDGDALRLAVKLGMFDGSAFALFMNFRLEETRLNPARNDYEITRRAITRAAAAIGAHKEGA